MIISFFHNAGDNLPAQTEVTWEQLVEGLSVARSADCTLADCKRSECKHKNGPAWSTARYIEGGRRAVSNVLDVHAMLVDLDHIPPQELDSVLANIASYKKVVHGSHSDRSDDRCLRAVLAVSRPVPARDWYRFWDAVIRLLGIPADKQVKDPSRLYFLPSHPKDSDYMFFHTDGVILDVDAILASAPEDEPVDSEDWEIPAFAGAPSQTKLIQAIKTLAGGWPEQGRNTAQLALCGALARAGWPVELIADFVEAVCDVAHPGNGDRPKRLKSARASVAKVQAGEMVAGWPTVEEYVDPEVVKATMDALGMGGPRHDPDFLAAMNSCVHDENVGIGKLVTVTRDDIQSALQAARKRLGRSSNAKKIKDAKLLGRALDGKPFTEHPDEDQDQAFVQALQAIVRHAPRGASNIVLAEYLTKSRPDIGVDTLCTMVEQARNTNEDDERAELPPDDFEIDFRSGKPSASSKHNLDIAFRKLGVTFYLDAFSRKKVIEKKIDDSVYREIVSDNHVIQLMFDIERDFKFSPPKEKLYDYCGHIAYTNQFHPVRDYLDGLATWDGVSRTETWLIDFGGAEDTPYTRAVSRLILVAAVRRVRQPGCKFDEMLILESPQGAYKSTAIKTLCPNPDWFSDNFDLDSDSKVMIEQTSGKWIVEAGELKGMSSKDHTHLKQCLSRTHDEARMAYARESQRLPRQFIIIGTTNDTQYLRDHTGDRRYWPVRVGIFNVAALGAIRDQLWAEAAYLEAANPADDYTRLDPSLYGAAAAEQSKRKVDNAVKVRLEEYLGGRVGRIKVSDTWRLLSEDPVTPHSLVSQGGNAMQELGWQRVRVTEGEKRIYYYMRGTREEQKKNLIVTGNMSFGFTIKECEVDESGNLVVNSALGSVSRN